MTCYHAACLQGKNNADFTYTGTAYGKGGTFFLNEYNGVF